MDPESAWVRLSSARLGAQTLLSAALPTPRADLSKSQKQQPSLLMELGARSEKDFVAKLHGDCCCDGDSQTAQSPLLLSGVPQHEK